MDIKILFYSPNSKVMRPSFSWKLSGNIRSREIRKLYVCWQLQFIGSENDWSSEVKVESPFSEHNTDFP